MAGVVGEMFWRGWGKKDNNQLNERKPWLLPCPLYRVCRVISLSPSPDLPQLGVGGAVNSSPQNLIVWVLKHFYTDCNPHISKL